MGSFIRKAFMAGCLFSFIYAATAQAAVQNNTISIEVNFPQPVISTSTIDRSYDHVEMTGLLTAGAPGEPMLPSKGVNILIPSGKKVKSVTFTPGAITSVVGEFYIEPGQRNYPISKLESLKPAADQPLPAIYQQNPKQTKLYPANNLTYLGTQIKHGASIAVINVCPIRYNPTTRNISYYQSMIVTVTTVADPSYKRKETSASLLKTKTAPGKISQDLQEIIDLIDNKDAVSVTAAGPKMKESANASNPLELVAPKMFTDSKTAISTPWKTSLSTLGSGPYPYVIITGNDNLKEAFAPLIDRRTKKGLPAITVTTKWITDMQYPGPDKQARIRNFIIDAYNTWGTRYVLLGGDNNIIPARLLNAQIAGDSDTVKAEYMIASDVYYACLDGSYNDNGNGDYGEPTDGPGGGEVNLWSRVYVGRSLVSTTDEVKNFVNKTLAYEDSTDKSLSKNYMIGEYLDFGPDKRADAYMEEIRLGKTVPTGTLLDFSTQGFMTNPDRAVDTSTAYIPNNSSDLNVIMNPDVFNLMNTGVHLINHLGHCQNDQCLTLYKNEVDTLTNKNYFIINSQGCYPGSFDGGLPTTYVDGQEKKDRIRKSVGNNFDCVVRHYTIQKGGAVAFIGNTRYGWGSRSNTLGTSQYFQRQFWHAYFANSIAQLGKMNQASKEANINYMNATAGHRWVYFTVTLFGDPALEINSHYGPFATPVSTSWQNLSADGTQAELVVGMEAFNNDATGVTVAAMKTDSADALIVNEGNVPHPSAYATIPKGKIVDNTLAPFKIKFPLSVFASNDYSATITLRVKQPGNYFAEKEVTVPFPNPRERKIPSFASETSAPAIANDVIYWQDDREGNQEIYSYDPKTNEKSQVSLNISKDYKTNPKASGNYIVWTNTPRDKSTDSTIYLYNLSTRSGKTISALGASHPDISGDYVTWEDNRSTPNKSRVYLYQISTNSSQQIAVSNFNQHNPRVLDTSSKTKPAYMIVWEEDRTNTPNSLRNIVLFNYPANNKPVTICKVEDSKNPVFASTQAILAEHFSANHWNIYQYLISGETGSLLTKDGGDSHNPAAANNMFVWDTTDSNGNTDIFSTTNRKQLTSDPKPQTHPAFSGNIIAWVDERGEHPEIYFYNRSTTAPTATVSINNGAKEIVTEHPENQTPVTLTFTTTPGASGFGPAVSMQINNGNFEPFTNSKSILLPPGTGLQIIRVNFSDALGNKSTASTSINVLTAATSGSIKINAGAKTAPIDTTTVSLTLSAQFNGTAASNSSSAKMRFCLNSAASCTANDPTGWTNYEPFSASKSIALTGEHGTRYVSVMFKQEKNVAKGIAGQVSPVYTAAIYWLRPRSVTGSIQINNGAATVPATATSVTLNLSSTDYYSDPSFEGMRLQIDPPTMTMRICKGNAAACPATDASKWSAYESFKTTKSMALTGTTHGARAFSVMYKDEAGTVSPVYTTTTTWQ
ncbi:MAG: hypothetical protein HQL22_01185 [Candidatus Omnitrophica bacterium]|nr:hypothetical protein [Candidatus Omnitrophota bacterium]